jgi:hypothetical protein
VAVTLPFVNDSVGSSSSTCGYPMAATLSPSSSFAVDVASGLNFP